MEGSRRNVWYLLTVTAASTAPAIPPENRDNAGDILCFSAEADLGLCVVPIGLAKSALGLVVEAIDAIVNNCRSTFYCVDVVSGEGIEAVDKTRAAPRAMQEDKIEVRTMIQLLQEESIPLLVPKELTESPWQVTGIHSHASVPDKEHLEPPAGSMHVQVCVRWGGCTRPTNSRAVYTSRVLARPRTLDSIGLLPPSWGSGQSHSSA